jgi:transcriptional regulator with XRE-family HTH domain
MAIGEEIAKARKAARLTIEDLAEKTNIPRTLLRDMENNNFLKCGGDTYARGHLREIAQELNVSKKLFLDLYESEVSAPEILISTSLQDSNVLDNYQAPKRISWKILVATSISALIIFTISQMVFSSSENMADQDIEIAPSASPSITGSVTPSPVQPVAPVIDGAVKVEVRATRAASWLYVSNESGNSLYSGQLSIGSSRTFSSDVQVNLKVGNAGGVDLIVNGVAIQAIGANREVVNLSYGPDSP